MSDNSLEYIDLGNGHLEVNPRPDLLLRVQAAMSSEAAFDQLHQQLATAAVIYEKHGDGGREGAWRALTAVVGGLHAQGIPLATLLPLASLATALADADRRVASPLFAVKRGGGQPPKPIAETIIEQFVAVVMECYVRHYRDKEKIVKFLDKSSRDASKLINSEAKGLRLSAKRVREIREVVSAKKSRDPTRQAFDELMREAAAAPTILGWVLNFVRSSWATKPKLSEQPPV